MSIYTRTYPQYAYSWQVTLTFYDHRNCFSSSVNVLVPARKVNIPEMVQHVMLWYTIY
jgi:hypothetical protein